MERYSFDPAGLQIDVRDGVQRPGVLQIRGCTALSRGFIFLLRAGLRCQYSYTSLCRPDPALRLPGNKDKCSSRANERTGNWSLKPRKMMEIIAYFFLCKSHLHFSGTLPALCCSENKGLSLVSSGSASEH